MARLMRHSKAVECAVRWTSSVSVVERRRQHADMLLLRAGRLGKEMLIFKRDWRRNACQWRAERRAGTHTHTHTHTCPRARILAILRRTSLYRRKRRRDILVN